MEKNLAPLCLYLAVILGIISFLNATGITFLIPVLLRFRYSDKDIQEDGNRIHTEVELGRQMSTVGTVGGKL